MTKRRIQKIVLDLSYPICTILIILFLWHYLVVLLNFPPYILPLPTSIPAELLKAPGLFWYHSWITIYETFAGLGLSVVLGVPIAITIVWSRTLEKAIMPLLVISQTFPKSAVAPLFIIWFGYGTLPKIIISFLVAFFPIVINTIMGLRSVDPDMLDLVHSLSASKIQVFRKARIPTAVPFFFSGLKIAITLALIGAIVGEFVGADKGLGYLLIAANNNLDTTLCFAALGVLVTVGGLMFFVVGKLEGWIWPSHGATQPRE